MAKQTIKQIKDKINQGECTEEELETFRQDERKGVQKVLEQYDINQQKKVEMQNHYESMLAFEKEHYADGRTLIAGIDEAGRGPLAGPVVAGAVIMPKGYYLEGLNDSKKLSLKKREEFFEEIKEVADWGVGIVTNEEIDRFNIYQATKLAMKRAVNQLSHSPEHLLVDAMDLEDIPCTQTSLVKGDQRSVSIAAASVMAKVTRDRMMAELDDRYPVYQFRSNQGYGTKDHLEALSTHGASPVHRLTFAPVKNVL
ncbi:ribonuclease HII [Halobacillus litoralis]|uniref:ribonuclease HII n=1 Tax=Halobacillus litoralis TaxID=45668 RepID=UPI001CFDB263|nr:ribonuclease HII [Halobacillus litoralis]